MRAREGFRGSLGKGASSGDGDVICDIEGHTIETRELFRYLRLFRRSVPLLVLSKLFAFLRLLTTFVSTILTV
jgi:hypothetical protein